jgi:spore coat polysaccharide biosynthesis predicted glycosyltransferase SpsG
MDRKKILLLVDYVDITKKISCLIKSLSKQYDIILICASPNAHNKPIKKKLKKNISCIHFPMSKIKKNKYFEKYKDIYSGFYNILFNTEKFNQKKIVLPKNTDTNILIVIGNSINILILSIAYHLSNFKIMYINDISIYENTRKTQKITSSLIKYLSQYYLTTETFQAQIQPENTFTIQPINSDKHINQKIMINIIGNHIVGTGHIKREELIINNLCHLFPITIVSSDSDVINYFSKKEYVDVLHFSSTKQLNEIITKKTPTLFINDTLNSNSETMLNIKKKCPRILSYEDCGMGTKYCNIIINELYSRKSMKYFHSNITKISKKKFRCGIKYFSLRKEFQNHNPIKFKPKIINIIITFGGTDPMNYTETVLDFLVKYKYVEKYLITVILGLGYIQKKKIIKKFGMCSNITFHINVTSMPNVLQTGDIAISSQGRTCCELLYMNIPTMVLPQNSREILHDYATIKNGMYNIGIFKNLIHGFGDIYLKKCFDDFLSKREELFLVMEKKRHKIKCGLNRNLKIIEKLINEKPAHDVHEIISTFI